MSSPPEERRSFILPLTLTSAGGARSKLFVLARTCNGHLFITASDGGAPPAVLPPPAAWEDCGPIDSLVNEEPSPTRTGRNLHAAFWLWAIGRAS